MAGELIFDINMNVRMNVQPRQTIRELKGCVYRRFGVSRRRQVMLHRGIALADERRLGEFDEITEGDTITVQVAADDISPRSPVRILLRRQDCGNESSGHWVELNVTDSLDDLRRKACGILGLPTAGRLRFFQDRKEIVPKAAGILPKDTRLQDLNLSGLCESEYTTLAPAADPPERILVSVSVIRRGAPSPYQHIKVKPYKNLKSVIKQLVGVNIPTEFYFARDTGVDLLHKKQSFLSQGIRDMDRVLLKEESLHLPVSDLLMKLPLEK